MQIHVIATIHNDFTAKFGIPRQSGLVQGLQSVIVFEPEYRSPEAVRGLEGYSHLWLLWHFSKAERQTWSATVRPPRLGGNTRMGVFATRSPYRPNPIGLSSVVLDRIELDEKLGPLLYVSGADLLDGTPIFDIKPYLAYTDSHPEASDGFALATHEDILRVNFPAHLMEILPEHLRQGALALLAQDPRPAYQSDPSRRYAMQLAEWDIRFTVQDDLLTVCQVVPFSPKKEH